MNKKRSFFTSVITQRCPRCRQGKLFKYHPYNFNKFAVMHDNCENCAQNFKLEPSFYDGAMYVSYALQVALVVSVSVAFYVLYPDAEVIYKISAVIILVLLLFPMVLRLSRSLWIHFFVNFKRPSTE